MKNKDSIDIGSCCGDSAAVLDVYTSGRIFSYDTDLALLKIAQATLRANKMDLKRHYFENKKMRDFERLTMISDSGTSTAIDEEVSKNKMEVGFIKIAAGRENYLIFRGANNTVEKQRPIISIEVFKDARSLINISKLLIKSNYEVLLETRSSDPRTALHLSLFAYPKEI